MKKILLTVFLFLSLSSLSWGRVVVSYPTNYLTFLGPYYYHMFSDSQAIDLDFDGIYDIFLDRKFSSIPRQRYTCQNGGTFQQFDKFVNFELNFLNGKIYSKDYSELFPGNTFLSTGGTQYNISGRIGGGTLTYSEPESGSNPNPNCLLPPSEWYISGLINNTGYAGFKWVKNGLTYFGYIFFRDRQIYSVAYENIPGYPITTGDTRGYFGSTDPTPNTIRGVVYNDINKNCTKDAGEKGIPNVLIYTVNSQYAAYTDQNGNYELVVNGQPASYQVAVDTAKHLHTTCPNNSSKTVTFTGTNQTILNQNFALEVNTCTKLSINITSDRRRRCFKNNTTITYKNEGGNDVSNAIVKVVLPPQVKPVSSTPAWSFQKGDTLIYNFTTLPSFSSGWISIKDSVICGDESIRDLTVCSRVFISPLSYCIPAGWDQSDVTLRGICTDDNYNVTIKNAGSGDMQDSLNYRIFMDNELIKVSKYKLKHEEILSFDILANGKTVRIEADQNQYHPELSYRAIFLEGCGTEVISKGILNNYAIVPSGIGEAISCMPIIDSYDPNDKQASPEGFGLNSYIEKNTDLTYTIRFQNTGSDTAYTVVISDTLDTNLDYSTIETIGSSHPYKFEITGKSNPRLAWIFGGINLVHKSQNEPGSHGYVTFKVAQKPNLTDGTKITNKASIYFDYNSAIITNLVSREIGKPYVENLFALNSYTTPKDTLCTGLDAIFSVNATGAGLSYQWMKNNVAIADANSSIFTIKGLNSEATAIYQCQVRSVTDTAFTPPKKLVVDSNKKPSLYISAGSDQLQKCSPLTVDITKAFSDLNNTTGIVSYWSDETATLAIQKPEAINQSGIYYITKNAEGCTDTIAINAKIEICTGFNDNKDSEQVKVFPNPVSDFLNIEPYDNSYSTIEITDMTGRVLLMESFTESKQIDFSNWNTGIYHVRLKQDGKVSSYKIQKY